MGAGSETTTRRLPVLLAVSLVWTSAHWWFGLPRDWRHASVHRLFATEARLQGLELGQQPAVCERWLHKTFGFGLLWPTTMQSPPKHFGGTRCDYPEMVPVEFFVFALVLIVGFGPQLLIPASWAVWRICVDVQSYLGHYHWAPRRLFVTLLTYAVYTLLSEGMWYPGRGTKIAFFVASLVAWSGPVVTLFSGPPDLDEN